MAAASIPATKAATNRQRDVLQKRLARWLDLPLTLLGLAMLGLLIADLFVDQRSWLANRLNQAETAIWAIFAVDFAVELALAPSKARYLRTNWLTALAVVLPAFRVLRFVRVARALQGTSLVRILATLNRGTRALGRIARRGQFGYVLGLAVAVVLTGAGAEYYFEQGVPGAQITTPGEALWWAATVATTMNAGDDPVSVEGRIVGVLMRVFALGLSGYLTATIAVYLWGDKSTQPKPEPNTADLAAMRAELTRLRELVEQLAAPETTPRAGALSTGAADRSAGPDRRRSARPTSRQPR